MSGSIQTAIYLGYAQLANVIGQPFQQFRPLSVNAPTGPACFVQTLNAVFDARSDFKFAGTPIIGKSAWYVAVDGTQTAAGDFLIGPMNGGDINTWFISDQVPMQPIGAVKCNGVISIYRPAGNPGFGAQPYGGDAVSTLIPIMLNWPCSILQGTKGEKGDSQLPGDVRMPWFALQFPGYKNIQVAAGDVLVDDLGRRFKTSSAEVTHRGWRLTAILAET
jgi:hypothetical protein